MLRIATDIQFDPSLPQAAVQALWKKSLPTLSARVLADCNRYARDDTGCLIASSAVASDLNSGKLVWATPYARRVYYAGAPSRAHNPNASLRWCQSALAAHLPEWQALVSQAMGGD
ncbi:MAG TPA: minor capsid protein [Candidatus Limiplasma sp.]|nr:minor capsid protein [Candidatus Limiplasma sp.]